MPNSPFDWLNTINDSKRNLISEDPNTERLYNPFMVNRGLSYFSDSIMYANEMNRYPFLDKRVQYEFYLSSISKRKRFSKWAKKEEVADVELIKQVYSVSEPKALEILNLLTAEQLSIIRNRTFKGGR